MVGPPWTPAPAAWSLDGQLMPVRTPSTIELVSAIMVPKKGWDTSGLGTVIVCTERRAHKVIGEAAFRRDQPMLLKHLDRVADALVLQLTGWKRWEAAHLWEQSIGAWREIDGDLTAQGVDVTELPPGRATNAIYAWWWRLLRSNADEWKRFTRDLQREPRRVIIADAEKPMDAGAFAQLAALSQAQAKSEARSAVPTSTIVMPEQIP